MTEEEKRIIRRWLCDGLKSHLEDWETGHKWESTNSHEQAVRAAHAMFEYLKNQRTRKKKKR